MSDAGLGCQVYVDGARLADTAEAYVGSTPTVLTGLSLTWGRSTVVDQPDVSSCTFTVADKGGDADFLGVLHVGRIVDVYGSAEISGGTDPVDVIVDGSFEINDLAARIRYSGGTAVIDMTNPYDGDRAIRATPQPAVKITIPPAPWSTDPTAWNAIPKAMVGQTWTVGVQLQLGTDLTATIQPVAFASPASSDGTPVGTAHQLATPSTNYQPLAATWTADQETWLGMVVTITGVRRWVDLVGPWTAQTWTWQAAGTALVDAASVLAPPQAAQQVLAFSGRITDLTASSTGGRVEVAVTASDRLADLGNDYIGDNPWAMQTIGTRVTRIVSLAATRFSVDIAAWPKARNVTWVDIDSQPVAGLLSDLATTADAVLWSRFLANRGFSLWMEDPGERQAMATLALVGGVVEIVGQTRPGGGIAVSACDMLNDDVAWRQDVADVLSVVDLTWLEQTLDEEGMPAPTERHIVITDAAAVTSFGQRRLGYETQLVNATDGNTVATRLMSRSRSLGWMVSGMTWDTDAPIMWSDEDRATALRILNGTLRIGLPIVISDLPDWTPSGPSVPCYLEGGTYTYEAGRWVLAMNLSPAGLTGQSLTWAQTDPSFTWAQVDPDIAWFDMWGVGPTITTTQEVEPVG
jgi:hypothetical protein